MQLLLALASDGLHFVDLQYGDTTQERYDMQSQHGIDVQHLHETDNFTDIDGLAALICASNIVVTTSNTATHLTGALEKQTLRLLPYGKGRLWYLASDDHESLWYPSVSMPKNTQGIGSNHWA